MNATPIVFSAILYLLAFVLIRFRLVASPCCAFLGMLVLSYLHDAQGYPVVPMDSSLIFGWLCVSVLVTIITLLQPRPLRESNKGVWFMTGGAFVGLAVGLLSFNYVPSVNGQYAVMIVAVAAATFFGFLAYTYTPAGKAAAIGSGRFFPYLFAKGFPIAITVMLAGVVLIIIEAIHHLTPQI